MHPATINRCLLRGYRATLDAEMPLLPAISTGLSSRDVQTLMRKRACTSCCRCLSMMPPMPVPDGPRMSDAAICGASIFRIPLGLCGWLEGTKTRGYRSCAIAFGSSASPSSAKISRVRRGQSKNRRDICPVRRRAAANRPCLRSDGMDAVAARLARISPRLDANGSGLISVPTRKRGRGGWWRRNYGRDGAAVADGRILSCESRSRYSWSSQLARQSPKDARICSAAMEKFRSTPPAADPAQSCARPRMRQTIDAICAAADQHSPGTHRRPATRREAPRGGPFKSSYEGGSAGTSAYPHRAELIGKVYRRNGWPSPD